MKLNPFKKEEWDLEQELLSKSLAEVFNFLHTRMDEKGMPVRMGIMYQDVLFSISCEQVENMTEKRKEFFGDKND